VPTLTEQLSFSIYEKAADGICSKFFLILRARMEFKKIRTQLALRPVSFQELNERLAVAAAATMTSAYASTVEATTAVKAAADCSAVKAATDGATMKPSTESTVSRKSSPEASAETTPDATVEAVTIPATAIPTPTVTPSSPTSPAPTTYDNAWPVIGVSAAVIIGITVIIGIRVGGAIIVNTDVRDGWRRGARDCNLGILVLILVWILRSCSSVGGVGGGHLLLLDLLLLVVLGGLLLQLAIAHDHGLDDVLRDAGGLQVKDSVGRQVHRHDGVVHVIEDDLFRDAALRHFEDLVGATREWRNGSSRGTRSRNHWSFDGCFSRHGDVAAIQQRCGRDCAGNNAKERFKTSHNTSYFWLLTFALRTMAVQKSARLDWPSGGTEKVEIPVN
jgi:hypothetical protein